MQLAKLYLRGSLVNETMKNLTHEQQKEVEAKLEILMNDKTLQGCKNQFCNVLMNTIGGDYQFRDAALNDYRIALYKALVYIMYHKPNPEIFNDPQQVTRLFKNFVYQYMKQILNENKIPHSSSSQTIKDTPYRVSQQHIIHLLECNNITHEINAHAQCCTIIMYDTPNVKLLKKIDHVIKKYRQYDVIITHRGKIIHINNNNSSNNHIKVKLEKRLKINISNLDHDYDDDNSHTRYDIEEKIDKKMSQNDIHTNYGLLELVDILPDDVVPIFNLITNTPDDFIKTFNTHHPTKNQMAKYLNMRPSEVHNSMKKLKIYYCCYA